MQTLAVLVVFLPALAAAVSGFFLAFVRDRGAQLLTTGAVALAAVFSVVIFANQLGGGTDFVLPLLPWIQSGGFEVTWAIKVDTLTAVMLCVVTLVSAVVHLYSLGYMAEDEGRGRFQAYLSLFTFAMLMLVTADNLVQLFFGWEGVGLASYLLIGFWYHKTSANQAAMKAFIVNRVGDVGFALGIFGIFWMTGSIYFDEIFAAFSSKEVTPLFGWSQSQALNTVTLLLFIGAMGKSAQFFLHTWLPDAMEGPTPVSALIHAATMVTAGVFLIARMSPVFVDAGFTLAFVTVIGAATALFAATVGLTQFDIKRVIAYSTCSQLGYMVLALGLGLVGPAIFHLATHAFFKALLFLGAGSIIHALHHEQDMRNMGGLRKKLPWTHAYMLIGSLAIAGIGIPGPALIWLGDSFQYGLGFAGFHSKDAIIELAYVEGLAGNPLGYLGFWVGLVAAVLTAFYSWRLLYLTFYGTPRGDQQLHAQTQEAPAVMRYPLLLLALGAVTAGFLFHPQFIKNKGDFWSGSIVAEAYVKDEKGKETTDKAAVSSNLTLPEGYALITAVAPTDAPHGDQGKPHPGLWVFFAALTAGVSGILAAFLVYRNKGSGQGIARRFAGLNRLFANKWYFDEAYEALFVRPGRALGYYFWKIGDGFLIDGFGPNGVAGVVRRAAGRLAAAQTGYVYHYAFAMLIGLVLLISWFMLYLGRG